MRARSYLMCPPAHYAVSYAINPWMTGADPVDPGLAMRQWLALRDTYESLGHQVRLIDPAPGLPDMVLAANGGIVIGGRVLGARFRHQERAAEARAYLDWLGAEGYQPVCQPSVVNEGEGDLVFTGSAILAGYGFRTEPSVQHDLAAVFGLPVVLLRLTDPRFYHLDTALVVLAPGVAAYYPAAFDDAARAALASYFGELIEAKDEDAEVLGLNAVSDGYHVILPAQAGNLAAQLAARGFQPAGWTCRSFARQAAARSAARWNSGDLEESDDQQQRTARPG